MIKGFRAMIYKETIHILRDGKSILLMIILPGFELAIFGFAVNFDVRDIPTVVYNLDGRMESRVLLDRFRNTNTFAFVSTAASEQDLMRELVEGRARVGIKIPPNYTDCIRKGAGAKIQVLIDGSNSTVAMQALNVSNAIALTESVAVISSAIGATGQSDLPVEARPRVLFNPDLKTVNFMIPGLVAVLLHPLIIIFAATSLVREKEAGTLEQLMVTPISRWGVILGKLLPYAEISAFVCLLCFLVMRFLFRIPFAGNPLLLAAGTIFFIFTALGTGLLISTFSGNQLQSVQFSFMFAFPCDLLSGFVFPHEGMPTLVYYLAHCTPLMYFIRIIRASFSAGRASPNYGPTSSCSHVSEPS